MRQVMTRGVERAVPELLYMSASICSALCWRRATRLSIVADIARVSGPASVRDVLHLSA